MMRPLIGVTSHRHSLDGEMCTAPWYTESLLRAGGAPLVIPMLTDTAGYAELLPRFDGFLLTGSEADVSPERYGKTPPPTNYSDPLRDEQDFHLLRYAEQTNKPVFGICRGCQVMNVYRGGTLALHYRDLVETSIDHDHDDHVYGPPVHKVNLHPGTALAELLPVSQWTVNSLHRQVCERLGNQLRETARSEDGLIEGIEDIERPSRFYAVQWHPERSPLPPDALSLALFARLVQEARS